MNDEKLLKFSTLTKNKKTNKWWIVCMCVCMYVRIKLVYLVYRNAQHSRILTTKSCSLTKGSLPYVLHASVRPWFRSPSSHKPNLPLWKKIDRLNINILKQRYSDNGVQTICFRNAEKVRMYPPPNTLTQRLLWIHF